MDDLEKVKRILENIDEKHVRYTFHAVKKIGRRPVSEELVRAMLRKTERILHIEAQKAENVGEKKYKLWIKLSNRYCLILVIVLYGKSLNIITAWNQLRK